jgi:hypothetical protein
MKKNEKDIDRLITESLSEEEAKFYNELEEEGLFQMIKGVYRGKLGWYAIVTAIIHTIAVAVMVYCGYKLFTTESTTEILQYGTVLFIALSFGCMIKLWSWMEMQKNAITREMKRLEFQVAVLMEKLSGK